MSTRRFKISDLVKQEKNSRQFDNLVDALVVLQSKKPLDVDAMSQDFSKIEERAKALFNTLPTFTDKPAGWYSPTRYRK